MRKTAEIVIADEGRDKGKRFQIEEMAAAQAEKWALRALFAAMNAGIEIPDDVSANSGMAGIAVMGWEALAKVPFEKAEPLLDELMDCVKSVQDNGFIRGLVDSDTEEVKTRLKLRMEVFKLHVDVFMNGAA